MVLVGFAESSENIAKTAFILHRGVSY
jgi:hypothetical protein